MPGKLRIFYSSRFRVPRSSILALEIFFLATHVSADTMLRVAVARLGPLPVSNECDTDFRPQVVREVAFSNPSTSYVSVGVWIGIAFAVLFVLLVSVVFFIGHRKVSEYFVSLYALKFVKRYKLTRNDPRTDREQPGNVSPQMHEKASHLHSGCTPRTATPEIPFAAIEIEIDGRRSPRLPITSKRGSSVGGTPCSKKTSDMCASGA